MGFTMWFTFGGGGEDKEEIHVAENSFFWFWIYEDTIVYLFLLPLIFLPLKFNGFLLLLYCIWRWMWFWWCGEKFLVLLGSWSYWWMWKASGSMHRGMASRKPLFEQRVRCPCPHSSSKTQQGCWVFHFVQAKCRSLFSGVLGFILNIRTCTATINISVS